MVRKKLINSTIVYVLLIGYYALYGYLFERDLNFGLAAEMSVFLIPILFFFGLPVSLFIDKITKKIQNNIKTLSALLHFLFIGVVSTLLLRPIVNVSGPNLYCPIIAAALLFWLLNHFFTSTSKENYSINNKYSSLKRKLLVGSILFWIIVCLLVIFAGSSDDLGLGMFLCTLYLVPLIFFIGIPVSLLIEFLAKKVQNQYWGIISTLVQVVVFTILSYIITMFYAFGQWKLYVMDKTDLLYWLGGICLFLVIDIIIIFIKKEYKIKESKHVS
ncbi:hypothetical protein MK805_07225 [Shimazuella sp. AN120528]|nr:hypothetical protein [Shimazuella soli]